MAAAFFVVYAPRATIAYTPSTRRCPACSTQGSSRHEPRRWAAVKPTARAVGLGRDVRLLGTGKLTDILPVEADRFVMFARSGRTGRAQRRVEHPPDAVTAISPKGSSVRSCPLVGASYALPQRWLMPGVDAITAGPVVVVPPGWR